MSRLALAILAGSLTSAAALAEDVLTMPIERRPVVHGIAAKYPLDRGVVADPQVIFASGFENGFQGFTSFRHKQNCSVRKDAEVAHSGGACAEITATRGRDEGGGLRYKWQAGPGTVYFRFYCKFHKDTVRPHHFVSLTATAPDYRPGGRAGLRRTGVDSYHSVIEPPGSKKGMGWFFYTYWHEMRSWQNTDGRPNNPPNGTGTSFYGNPFCPDGQDDTFVRGRWFCVEMMMKENTPGEHDGEQAFWIDGRKYGHWNKGWPVGTWHRSTFWTKNIQWNSDPKPFEGMSWRTDAKVKLRQILLGWYVSRETARKATADRNIVYFDDIVVATSYIGPQVKPAVKGKADAAPAMASQPRLTGDQRKQAAAEKEAGRLLNMARQAERMGQRDVARKLYSQIVEKFPATDVAKKAKSKLD